MWQLGQVADTMSRSSEISSAQLAFLRGKLVPPFWSTLRKQPLAVVHPARPNWRGVTPGASSAAGRPGARAPGGAGAEPRETCLPADCATDPAGAAPAVGATAPAQASEASV